jgi:TonB-linked SusC/RagA family outer membrane protein
MRKQILFSLMLTFGVTGGMMVCPVSVKAAVTQQTIKVKGQVVDQGGEPLIGATVRVKGTQVGSVTDFDGNFQIDAPSNAVLVVSYVGFKDREIAVRGRSVIDKIEMENDSQVLEQLVVVGYGTQKKADLTGSVSVVNADELKRVSHSNISSMLEGKVAGVQITSDGQPGADPSVRIRGLGTFGSTAPLYVIDGVPMGTTIRDFSPNDIETIQVLKDASAAAIYGSRAANGVIIITTKGGQKDQPLKVDYKGYFGWDKISSGVYDVMNADQYSQYLGMACVNSGIATPGGYSLGEDGKYHFQDATNTDWFSEVFKTGTRQNHNINLSGGGANNTYNIGLDYFQQKGTLQGAGPNYQRFTARVNNTMDTKFIKFRTSLVYSHSNQDGMARANTDQEYVAGLWGSNVPVIENTLTMPPTIKAYDSNTWVLDDKVGAAKDYQYDSYGYGTYYDEIHGDIRYRNPLLFNNMLTRNTIVNRVVATGSADFDLLKMAGVDSKDHKLFYKLNLSYSATHANDKTWTSAWMQSNNVYLSKEDERLDKAHRHYTDFLVENTLNYDGTIGQHHINALVGITYEEENTNTLSGWGLNFSIPYYLQLQNASERDASSSESKHAINSYIGRLNYDYAGKYLLSFVIRRDGSSRLTKDIRWKTFPSVSLGWRFDKENFFPFDRNLFSMFKLRASYGELGNENIGEYVYMTTMARKNIKYSFDNQVVSGSAITTYVNENLAWEKKTSTNIGLDLAMFNNRIEFSAEWYKNKSSELLYNVSVPANAGVANTSVTMNAASMENSGVEFSLTYRNNDHALKHQITANVSTVRNKVTALSTGKDQQIDGICITNVGDEIGQFYGWNYQGIIRTKAQLDKLNQDGAKAAQEFENKKAAAEGREPKIIDAATWTYQAGAQVGDCYYADVNGDGQITNDDQEVLGSGMPKMNFGLSAHLEYKGFDLSISTYGALGYHVTDYIHNVLNSCYGYGNKDVSIMDANRWSEDGSTYISDVPRTYITHPGATLGWNDLFSDRKIQNAAYWKIANVELGYNIPNSVFKGVISGARIYVSAQNLLTITGYKGYNVDFAPGTFTPGYNYCSYPSARSFMCGVNFSF